MYYSLMITSIWLVRFSMLFSLGASTLKATTKENRGKLPAPVKIMWFHLLCAGFLQIIMTTLSQLHQNNMLLVHLYVVEEFVMDMLFYREILRKETHYEHESTKRPIFIIAIIAFAAFAVVNAAFITDTNHFPIYTFAVQSIVTVVCVIKYYHVRSFDGEDPVSIAELNAFKLYKNPVFFMNMGKLIYFFFALPAFILWSMAMENKEQNTATLLWIVQHFLLIILHIFMGIGFLKFTSNPSKVLDYGERDNKIVNIEKRKRFINDPDFAQDLRNDPDEFREFKEDNPDLFDDK